MVEKRQVIKHLPSVLQSQTLQRFFGATVDHLFQPQASEVVSGYIGRYPLYTDPEKDFYIQEPSKTRQDYSMEPIAISRATETASVTHALFYDDLLNHLRFHGGLINDHNRLFDNEFYSWCPPVDIDKLMNFKRYYWMPRGPKPIEILSLTDVERTLVGNTDYPLVFTGKYRLPSDDSITEPHDGTVEPLTLTSGMRLTIRRDVNSDQFNNKTFIIEGVGVSAFLIEEPEGEGGHRWDDLGRYTVTPYVFFIEDPNTDIQNFITAINGKKYFDFSGHYKRANQDNPWRPFDPMNPPDVTDPYDDKWEASYASPSEPIALTNNMLIIFVTYGFEQVTKYTYKTCMYKVAGVGKEINLRIEPFGWDAEQGLGWGSVALATTSARPDYLVMERGCIDGNPWSRGNRWFHEDVVARADRGTDDAIRAERPIIEFKRNLELYQYGQRRVGDVDVKEDVLTFTQINGFAASNPDFIHNQPPLREFGIAPLLLDVSARGKNWVDTANDPTSTWFVDAGSYTIDLSNPTMGLGLTPDEALRAVFYFNDRPVRIGFDYRINANNTLSIRKPTGTAQTKITAIIWDTEKGILIRDGMTILITNDPNPEYNNRIYRVSGIKSTGRVVLSPVIVGENESGLPSVGDTIRSRYGFSNLDRDFRFDGDNWIEVQRKTHSNQPPLFALYDIDGVALDDPGRYPESTFAGSRVFGFTDEASTGVPMDTILEMRVKHSASGHPIYKNYLTTERFNYALDKDEITGYYFHRTQKIDGSFDYSNDWYLVDIPSRQRIKHTYISTEGQTDFAISHNLTVDELIDPDAISVMVNAEELNLYTDYSVSDGVVSLRNGVAKNNLVTIYTYVRRAPDNLVGVYEVPFNLQGNPDSREVSEISYNEFFDHFTTILKSQKNFNGNVYGVNNYRDTPKDRSFGRVILQHRAPMLKTMIMASDQNIDFMLSIQYAEHEFSRFRNKFIRKIVDIYEQGIDRLISPEDFVNRALEEINVGKTVDFPFAYSTMCPAGDNFKVFDVSVDCFTGVNEYLIPGTRENIEKSFVYLEKNGEFPKLLDRGWDYETDVDEIRLLGDFSLNEADKIRLIRYDGYFTYVPPSPSQMGIYAIFRPGMVVDETLLNPRQFIQAHDGSYIESFTGEYEFLNSVVLEFEKRVYNNSSLRFAQRGAERIFDHRRFVSGKFRRPASEGSAGYLTDYSWAEWNSIIRPAFERWATMSRVNYRENQTWIADNPFTWNYGAVPDRDGQPLPGHWRGIYLYYFDTDHPHTHPWEMLGMSQKPDWWDAHYGVAPYTRGNTKLWGDLENGIIARGPTAGTYSEYQRPGMSQYIPVDDLGNLIDPVSAGICSRLPTAFEAQQEWKFGDHGPTETAWRRSPNFPFAATMSGYLIKPVRLIEYCWDTVRLKEIYRNQKQTRQWVYDDIRARRPHSYLTLHGEESSEVDLPQRYRVTGVQQWVCDYIKSRGQDITEAFGKVIRGIDVRLGHKMAGFVDQNTLQARADNFGLVPSENINVFLYRSPSIADHTYSGVIVQWTGRGWKVFGYDVVDPVFRTIPSDINGRKTKVAVGKTEKTGRPWQAHVVYTAGDIVVNQGVEYKCIDNHRSGEEFGDSFWKPLDLGPNNKGITVIHYLDANRAGNILNVPYGTEFYNPQDVFDFLVDYGRWLKKDGWVFEQMDFANEETIDWVSVGKDFLFWSLGRWAPGNTIALSPASKYVKFVTDHGEVQNIERIVRGAYSMLNRDGFMIQPRETDVSRVGNELVVTSRNDQLIYLTRLFVSEVEHVIIFDNVTIFNDLIYDPVFNLRQPRLRLSATRSMDWVGRMDAPGFIVTDNVLIPNFEKTVDDFRHFFGIEDGVDNPTLRNYSLHLVGYQGRAYMNDLLLDPKTEFQFFQGAMRQKGTSDAMQKLLRSFFVLDAEEVKFFDEWAFRVGNYGGVTNKLTFEFLLRQREVRSRPQLVEFFANNSTIADLPNDDVVNIPLEVQSWAPNTFYSKYEEVKFDNRYYSVLSAHTSASTIVEDIDAGRLVETENRWVVKPNREMETIFPLRAINETREGDLPVAGYARVDESDHYALDLTDLSSVHYEILQKGKNFVTGEKIWVYDINDEWQMFSVQNLGTAVVNVTKVEYVSDTETKITVSDTHNLAIDDLIVITTDTKSIPDVRGIHYVKSVPSTTEFIIPVVIDDMFDWTSQGGTTGPAVMKFFPRRFATISARNATLNTGQWLSGDLAYVDDAGNGKYAVYQYNGNNFDTIPVRIQPAKVDNNRIFNAVIYDKKTTEVQQYVHLYDPAKGIIPGTADAEIWYKLEIDPAVYNNGDPKYHRMNPEIAWGGGEEHRLWWDLSTVKFLDYEISDNKYRKYVWGRLAPRATIDVYEWTRSTVPPTEWARQVEINKGKAIEAFDAKPTGSVKDANNPAWCERTEYDPATGDYKTVYYFWVKNKATVPPVEWRKLTTTQVAKFIENPSTFDMPWFAPISPDATIISGVDYLLNDENSIVQVNYRRTDREDNVHREWVLMREGDDRSYPDPLLWRKMTDSLVGFNVEYMDVPDPSLSTVERYGNLFRPRQSWFIDRYMARRIIVERVNTMLTKRPVMQGDLTYLQSSDEGLLTFTEKSPRALVAQKHVGSSIGLLAKIDVDLATATIDGNVDLTGGTFPGTIDRVFVREGNRVLVKNQTDATENGIYVYHENDKVFVRATDCAAGSYLPEGANIYVRRGNDNRGTKWIQCVSNAVVGVDNNNWFEVVGDFDYHMEVDSFDERNTKEIDPDFVLERGTRVLVRGNTSTNGFWSLWSYDPTVAGRWSCDAVQHYKTVDFWSTVDWYDTGYSKLNIPRYVFPSEVERDIHDREVGFSAGDLIRIDKKDINLWYWQEYQGKVDGEAFGRWKMVAYKNGTIKLSDRFYDESRRQIIKDNYPTDLNAYWETVRLRDGSLEFKAMLKALMGDTDIPGLLSKGEINALFFAMVHYAHTEHRMVDWAFKTSFLFIKGINEPLIQEPVLRKDKTDSIIGYINEVKPYHSKIRDFTLSKILPMETGHARVTDFDKPVFPLDRTIKDHAVIDVVWNGDGTYTIADPYTAKDFRNSRHHKDWYENFQKIADDHYPVRSMKTTIHFDRVKWIDWYVDGEQALLKLYREHYGQREESTTKRAHRLGDRVWFHNYDGLNQDHWKVVYLRSPNHPIPTRITSLKPGVSNRVIVKTPANHNVVAPHYDMNPSAYDANISYVVGDIIRWRTKNYLCIKSYISTGDFDGEKLKHWSDAIPQIAAYVVIPQPIPEVVLTGDGHTKLFELPFRVDEHDLEVYVDGRLLDWATTTNYYTDGDALEVSRDNDAKTYTPDYEIVSMEQRENIVIRGTSTGTIALKNMPYHESTISVKVKRNLRGVKAWAAEKVYVVNDLAKHSGSVFVCTTSHTSVDFATDQSNWELITPDAIIPRNGTPRVTNTDPLYTFMYGNGQIVISPTPKSGDQLMITYKTDPGVRLRINETPKNGQTIYIRRRSQTTMVGAYKVMKYVDANTIEIKASLPSDIIFGSDNIPMNLLTYRDDVLTLVNEKGDNITVPYDNTMDPNLLTQAERIMLYYRPTPGMPAKDMRELLDINFKGTRMDGGDLLDTKFSEDVGNHVPVMSFVYNGQDEVPVTYWQDGMDNSLGWGDHIFDSIRDKMDGDVVVVEYNGIVQLSDAYDFYYNTTEDLWKVRFNVLPNHGDLITVAVVTNDTVDGVETTMSEKKSTRYYDMNVMGGTFTAPASTSGFDDVIVDGGFFLAGPSKTFEALDGQQDFQLDGAPVVGVIGSADDLNWHARVYVNGRRRLDGYHLENIAGTWHVIFDESVVQGTEVRIELQGKPAMTNPYMDENRPQELIATRTADSLGITVYTEATAGAPSVVSARYEADDVTTHFELRQKPSSRETVFVTVGLDGENMMLEMVSRNPMTGNPLFSSDAAVRADQYYLHWDTGVVELGIAPPKGAVIKITSFSAGGTNVENIDTFVSVGVGEFTLTKLPAATPNIRVWTQVGTQPVTEITNFNVIEQQLFLGVAPTEGTLVTVTYEIEDAASNDFQNNQNQRIVEIARFSPVNGIMPPLMLKNPEGITYSQSHVSVVRDGEVLSLSDYSVIKHDNGTHEVVLTDGEPGEVAIVAFNTPNIVKVRTHQYQYTAGEPIILTDAPSPTVPHHGAVLVYKKITEADLICENGQPAGTLIGDPLVADDVGRGIRLMPPTTRYFLGDGGCFAYRFERPITSVADTQIWIGQNPTPLVPVYPAGTVGGDAAGTVDVGSFTIPQRFRGPIDANDALPCDGDDDLKAGDYFVIEGYFGFDDGGYDGVPFDNTPKPEGTDVRNWLGVAFAGTWALKGMNRPNPNQTNQNEFGFEDGDMILYLGRGRWSRMITSAGMRNTGNYAASLARAVVEATREIHFFDAPSKNADICFVWYEHGKYDYDIKNGNELHLYGPTFAGLTLEDGDWITVTTFSDDEAMGVRTEVFTATVNGKYPLTRVPSDANSLWVNTNGRRNIYGMDYTIQNSTIGWDNLSWDAYFGWDDNRSRPLVSFNNRHSGDWRVVVTTFANRSAQQPVGFRLFKNSQDEWEYLRIADVHKTKLNTALDFDDRHMQVVDAKVFVTNNEAAILSRKDVTMYATTATLVVNIDLLSTTPVLVHVIVSDNAAGGAADGIITHADIAMAINSNADLRAATISAAVTEHGHLIIRRVDGQDFSISDSASDALATAFFGNNVVSSVRPLLTPEAVFVDGERIEYMGIDVVNNRLLNIRRGTGGTSSGIRNIYRNHMEVSDGLKEEFVLPGWFDPMNDDAVMIKAEYVDHGKVMVKEYRKESYTVTRNDADEVVVKFPYAPTEGWVLTFSATVSNWEISGASYPAGTIVVDGGAPQYIPGGYRWEGLLDKGFQGQLDAIPVGTKGVTQADAGRWYQLSRAYDAELLDIRVIIEHEGFVDPETGEPRTIEEQLIRYQDWFIDGTILKFRRNIPAPTNGQNNIILHLRSYRGLQYSNSAMAQFLREKPATHYWGN